MKSGLHVFAEHTLLTGLSLGKVMLRSLKVWPIPREKRNTKDCVILANGPSLNQSIDGFRDKLVNYDLFAVNYFSNSAWFEELRPQFLVVSAPEFFLPDVLESYRQSVDVFFHHLAKKTSWPLTLFFPSLAHAYPSWQEKLEGNKELSWNYYHTTPAEGFEGFVQWAMRTRKGMPRPHNVLIPSLILALQMGYERIYVLGADHSWMKELWVDEDNRVLLKQKHFYDEQSAQAAPMYKLGKEERMLHEILEKFQLSFQAYWVIKRYAVKHGQQILNLTPGSYIDAFPRLKQLP